MKDINVSLDILENLFDRAKECDEFEFCCTLLRVKGLEDYGWDPLLESDELISQFSRLLELPIKDIFKMRTLLFLYSHTTEIDDFYNITANLIRIIMGERYVLNPFKPELHPSGQAAYSPKSKIERINEWSQEVNMNDLGEVYNSFLIKQVRNAFFHSDYVLSNNEFRIIKGEKINIDGKITSSINYSLLIPRIELALNLVRKLISLVNKYRSSYREEKVIKPKLFNETDSVKLLVNETGLVGFKIL
ncbi:MAG: hypothetical protein ACOCRO_09140 [Halanaerobiales bacterium]